MACPTCLVAFAGPPPLGEPSARTGQVLVSFTAGVVLGFLAFMYFLPRPGS